MCMPRGLQLQMQMTLTLNFNLNLTVFLCSLAMACDFYCEKALSVSFVFKAKFEAYTYM